MSCQSEEKYKSKDGNCCDRCPAGTHVRNECNDTKKTECAECLRGFFTATSNHLKSCRKCNDCRSNKHQKKSEDCTAKEDTVCECETGFFCINEICDHCQEAKRCGLGQGVKIKANRTTDTVCSVCEEGTYSNVIDSHSACQTHTRCEDLGRVIQTPGTHITDAICGDFKSHCHWIIPAGLWSGLVLTALIMFGLIICWRWKRKSFRTGNPCVPGKCVNMTQAERLSALELPLPSTEQNGHYTLDCMGDSCKLPLFTPDNNVISVCTPDSVDSTLPITPLKASVSFVDSSQGNGKAGNGTANFLRTYSEPQEDEWCGTEASERSVKSLSEICV